MIPESDALTFSEIAGIPAVGAVPRASSQKSILFVDDEANILSGLRRMLRPMRESWDMEFVDGGAQALARLAEKPFDIVVSDMRMPNVDGSALFGELMRRHPETIRIILSGQSDRQGTLNAVGCTHQFLSKPCDSSVLLSTLTRMFALRDQLGTPAVKRLSAYNQILPSQYVVCRELLAEIQSSERSIERVGTIISSDLGLSAKLFHLSTSCLFGRSRTVATPTQAATLLGFDVVKSLVLFVDVASQSTGSEARSFSLNQLANHSLNVATLAKTIAESEKSDRQQINDAFIAGLLHDIGKLVLMANIPEQYLKVRQAAVDHNISILDAEKELLGATHAEVGAYLMGLWGLAPPIVDSIAFHHRPNDSASTGFTPLTAVHIANALSHGTDRSTFPDGVLQPVVGTQLDREYIGQLGLSDKLDAWSPAALAHLTTQEPTDE